MASRFLQKYHMPEGFQDILSELVREVLRAQPDDIIEFLANYCEARANGQEYQYDSIYNVKKREIPEQPSQEHYKDLTSQVKNLVKSSNQQQVTLQPIKKDTRKNLLDDIPEPQATYDPTKAQQEFQQQTEDINEQQQEQQQEEQEEQQQDNDNQSNRPQTKQSSQSRAVSAKSEGVQSNATSHPEEKGLTREFMGDLYSSAINQMDNSNQQQQQQGKVEIDFAEIEENREEFDQAARFIQKKYKEKKNQQEE